MLIAGVLIGLSVYATRVSVRSGVPALVLFLATGMLAGSEGLGGLHFDDTALAWAIGVPAVGALMFASGLDTDAAEVRPILGPGLVLATVAVVLSALLTGFFWSFAFDRPLAEGLLLGSIISSTDAAAVFGILRNASVRLKGKLQPMLELESGSNDPMAIFLTVATTALVMGELSSPGMLLAGMVGQLVVGGLAGLVGGRGMAWALNHLRVTQEPLYSVFAAALALVLFGVTWVVGGSPYLAVYVAGIALSAMPFVHRRAVIRFHSSVAWLVQIGIFLMLGLLVFPSRLPNVAAEGLAVAVFLLFVARPVAVFVSLAPFRIPFREQVLVAWVGLRGAVPIVLAIWPRLVGAPNADMLFDVVFFVVLFSVLVQGTSLPAVARWLGLGVDEAPSAAARLESGSEVHGTAMIGVRVGPRAAGRPLVEMGLPAGALVAFIEREDEVVVPQGSTAFAEGDLVRVLVRAGQEPEVRSVLDDLSMTRGLSRA